MGEATYNNVYGNGTIGDITRAMKASGSTAGGKQLRTCHKSYPLLTLQKARLARPVAAANTTKPSTPNFCA